MRNTLGLGVLDVILRDPRVEDVFVDAPCQQTRVYLTLNQSGPGHVFGRCETNVIVSEGEMGALVGRLKYRSGRPFSRSTPVLETDLGDSRVRATALCPPLSPDGLALALRRRSDLPWTLLRLAEHGAMDEVAAGLLSFLIDGRASILVCGARGSGKSSLLSALLFEFPLDQRVLVIEDTREVPVGALQALGFKVQSMLVGRGGVAGLPAPRRVGDRDGRGAGQGGDHLVRRDAHGQGGVLGARNDPWGWRQGGP